MTHVSEFDYHGWQSSFLDIELDNFIINVIVSTERVCEYSLRAGVDYDLWDLVKLIICNRRIQISTCVYSQC